MVEIGIEPEQRKGESVLSSGLAMTGTGVASGPREHRLDISLECNRTFCPNHRRSEYDNGDGGE